MTARPMVWTMVRTLALTVALLACKSGGSNAREGGARVTSPALDALLAGVPGDALAVGFVDLDTPPWALVTGGVMPLDEAARQTLDKELRAYLDRYVGVDVSKVQYAVGFVAGPPPMAAVLVKAIGGTLKLPGATDHEGGKLWIVDPDADLGLAMKGELVVFGKSAAVRGVLDTLAGKRKSILVENKPLVDWLHAQSPGAAVGLAAIAPKGLPLPPELAGLQRLAISLGRTGIRAVLEGEDAPITALQKMIDQGFAMALGEVTRAHDAAIAGDLPPPEGAFAIIGAAYARSYAEKLKPRREGNRLVASLDLGLGGTETMTIVAGIGVLSAVAIPAFMDYMKKSKVSESSLQLNKLARMIKVTYAVNDALPVGEAPLSPATRCCEGPDGKCPVDAAAWQHPIWQALEFQIDEPSRYQYRYASDGKTAVVEAVGDLDCDGQTAAYRLDVTTAGGSASVSITPPSNAD